MAIDGQRSLASNPASASAPVLAAEEGGRPYIECRDLFKIFKLAELEVVALRGVDLEVVPGEITAIVGASGSGKTTLLNILAGLERPSAGQVRVGDRDLLNISDRELVLYRRQEVGFVWQSTSRNLVPYLNVRDNLELPMAIARVPKSQRRERSTELLAAMQMDDKAQRFPDQLSGGEQQRVSIGVALANRPPLLLADEPTGELDTQMADEIFGLLRQMNQAFGVTVVVVTHYPGVARHTNRVVHIRDGRISAESFMQTTFRRPGDRVQQEYLVVDRVGRLQLPPDYVERLRRNGLTGLAAADFTEGQVTLRPAGRPDAAATVPKAEADTDSDFQPVEHPPTEIAETAVAPDDSTRDVSTSATPETPETPPDREAPDTLDTREPDPHALFRRPNHRDE